MGRLGSVQMNDYLVHEHEIDNIFSMAQEYFKGDPTRTALWFHSPNPSLGMVSPSDMIRYGRYKKVLSFIVDAINKNIASIERRL